MASTKSIPDNFLLEPSTYYLSVKEWHRKACPDNDCAAALLAFILSFHRYKQSLKPHARLTNEMLRAKGKPAIMDETDWQFHTDEMLERRLMFWKSESIRKATDYLRDVVGLIETEAPGYLKILYKTGRTKWFHPKMAAIQQWIDENYPRLETESPDITALGPVKRNYKSKDAEFRMIAKRIYKFRQRLLNEAENEPDKTKVNHIMARLKEGKDEIFLVQAVIGNFESIWHKGENPQGITFHQVRHTFKDSEKAELFQMLAETNGWTRAKTIDKYEELIGHKFEGRASDEQSDIDLTPEQLASRDRLYQDVGAILTELVIDKQMKIDEIVKEFYDRSERLRFTLSELTDHSRLGREIIQCLSLREIVDHDRRERILIFAREFIAKLKGDK